MYYFVFEGNTLCYQLSRRACFIEGGGLQALPLQGATAALLRSPCSHCIMRGRLLAVWAKGYIMEAEIRTSMTAIDIHLLGLDCASLPRFDCSTQ